MQEFCLLEVHIYLQLYVPKQKPPLSASSLMHSTHSQVKRASISLSLDNAPLVTREKAHPAIRRGKKENRGGRVNIESIYHSRRVWDDDRRAHFVETWNSALRLGHKTIYCSCFSLSLQTHRSALFKLDAQNSHFHCF